MAYYLDTSLLLPLIIREPRTPRVRYRWPPWTEALPPARIQTPRPTILQGNPFQIGYIHSIQARSIELVCPQTPQISARSMLSPGNCCPASSG
jgi:hypothetical protein